jgi:hypothetical protein
MSNRHSNFGLGFGDYKNPSIHLFTFYSPFPVKVIGAVEPINKFDGILLPIRKFGRFPRNRKKTNLSTVWRKSKDYFQNPVGSREARWVVLKGIDPVGTDLNKKDCCSNPFGELVG